MRLPSTLMTWWSGSTLAPYRRTISPSTSTRPSPISSSQCRRLSTPAAASTFCRRTPPGTSMSESCPGSAGTSLPYPGFPPPAPARPPPPPPPPPPGRRPPPPPPPPPRRPPPPPGPPPGRSLPSPARVLIARVPGTRRVLGSLSVLGTAGTRDAFLGAVGILDLVGQEGCEFRQLIQAGQAEPFQEVPGRA